MLRNLREIEGFAIGATDGDIGIVKDFYFDDDTWVLRYFVVETGTWHDNRRVLISPYAIGTPDWSGRRLPAALTRKQVENGPDIDTDKPVSRQHEMGYLGYYGYPNYWGGGGLWGAGFYPDILQAGMGPGAIGDGNAGGSDHTPSRRLHSKGHQDDLHLRSANSVMRYYVHATDGDVGHVQGVLVDETSWAIRYMIVNTSNWWLGHEVLIAPEWIDHFDWLDSKLVVALSRESVKNAPVYDSKQPLDREQEAVLHAYYGKPGYWPVEGSRK
jgi:uncharacterized protein YrrD